MSVNPGFGGQKFIPSVLHKISEVRNLINNNYTPLIEVDGGINLDNLEKIAAAGANIFVMGSAIFNHPGKYKNIITNAREILGK